MAESSARKIKLLLLYEILRKQTDEQNPMTTQELSAALQDYGITVSRQTLYEDIEVLNHYGFDIVSEKGKKNRYYIGSRMFERPEAEILLQAICSSDFLTEKKKASLMKKVSELFGTANAEKLAEFISGSTAHGRNEHIYYNIDAIMTALLEKKQTTFLYYDYGLNGEKNYRKNGERYRVNPLGFVYSEENLYFFCYHDNHAEDGPTKYVVERMDDVIVEKQKITDIAQYRNFNLSKYKKELFSMYSGERREIALLFPQELLNIALGRFGEETKPVRYGDGEYLFRVSVQVSEPFFAWITSFGGRVRILMFRKLHYRLVRREAIPSIPVRCAAAVIRAMRRRRSDTAIRHLRRRLPARAADIRDIPAPAAETVIRATRRLLRGIAFPQALPIRPVRAQDILPLPVRGADMVTGVKKRSRSDTAILRPQRNRRVRKRDTRPINVRGAA